MPLFQKVLAGHDDELADRVRAALHMPPVLHPRTEPPRAGVSSSAAELGEKSLEKGYLKDALKYLTIAHENDPVDFDVMLKLGWAYNMLKDDRDARALVQPGAPQPRPEDRRRGVACVSQSEARVRPFPHHGLGFPDVFDALARPVRLCAGQNRAAIAGLVRSSL